MTVDVRHGDSREILKSLADCSIDACVTDLSAGTAAEHLVCADLLLSGHRAFLAAQICPYDVAVEYQGKLIRIQVKATRTFKSVDYRRSHTPAYMWHTRRAGKRGARQYGSKEFDIIALVALDIRCIAYLGAINLTLQTIHLRPPGTPKNHPSRKHGNVDEYPFVYALAGVGA
jgi:hypothetical protein